MRRRRSSSHLQNDDQSQEPSGNSKKVLDPAEQYIKNCSQFELNVDSNVVIALRTRWNILKPTSNFDEGAMLPLMGVLDDNKHITKLNLAASSMQSRFRTMGNGNSNARVLSSILCNNNTIEEVDLSETGLDDDGVAEVCTALKNNKTITKLNLSGNLFGTCPKSPVSNL